MDKKYKNNPLANDTLTIRAAGLKKGTTASHSQQSICFTRIIFNPVFSLDLLLCVLTASKQLPRRFVNGRAVLAPAMRGLRSHLESVVRLGSECRKHHVSVGSEFVTDVGLITSGIEFHLWVVEIQNIQD